MVSDAAVSSTSTPASNRVHRFRSAIRILVLLCATSIAPTLLQLIHAQPSTPPEKPLRNFHHTSWSYDSQLGAVFDIQQSPDGYLWLTTSRGVYRFDGVRFQSADEITSGATKGFELASAFVSRSGDVWFRTRLPGLLLWRDGKLSAYPIKGCTPGLLTESMVQDLDGTIWVAGSAGLFIVGENKCELVTEKYGLPKGFPYALEADSAGTLWVKMDAGKLFYLPRGATRFKLSVYGNGTSGNDCYLHQGPNGSVWLSDAVGLRRVSENGTPPQSAPAKISEQPRLPRFRNFAFDSNGTLWVAGSNGLKRIENASALPLGVSVDPSAGDDFTVAQGLSSDVVRKILIDREGTVWVATNSGLDQLRHNVISQLQIPPTSESEFAVGAGDHGCVWVGNRNLPLTQVCPDGKTTTYPDTRQTITIRRDFKGGIWSSGLGVNHLWRTTAKGIEPVHFPNDGTDYCASMAIDKNNDIWLMIFGQNLYHRVGNTWENENKALGRERGILGTMESDEAGNIWVAFSNHVIEWDGAHYTRYTYTGKNRYPVSLTVKGPHVWLGAEDGVQLLTNGQFHMLRWQDPSLPGRITGMVETPSGDLWTNGFSGVSHVPANELTKWLRDPNYTVAAEKFDTLDGLPGLASERYPVPSIAQAADGRLWFATIRGIAWLDPAALAKSHNQSPPTVLVNALIADGKPRPVFHDVNLPPRPGTVEIDYTALSLAVPSRVRFRYMLAGADRDWQDAGTRRQAYYTALRPGHYIFHVIACNNDGIWNDTGAVIAFTVAPAWYQTLWFDILCAAAAFLLMFIIYRMRVRHVARVMSDRFDERLAERTRIARDLHDTFLQTIQGSKLVADSALKQSLDPIRMRGAMEQLSGWLGRATEEGRAALNSLRSSVTERNDLAAAFHRAIEECKMENSIEASLAVTGDVTEMHPIVRDEVYRIGYEAIHNACTHSQATHLQVELTYAENLALRIADNGIGIDSSIADQGRHGHFGLQGMRERAARIGARLSIKSAPNSGTEVRLTVPGNTIYRRKLSIYARIAASLNVLFKRIGLVSQKSR